MTVKRQGATFLTVTELSRRAGIPRTTLITWINQGLIQARRQGLAAKSPFLIPEEEAKRVTELLGDGLEIG